MLYETRITELPYKSKWFSDSLESIARVNGKPLFRVVHGQRELTWRNGGLDVKHLLRHPDLPPFIIRRVGKRIEVKSLGIPAWVVEVYISPNEINYNEWCASRFKEMQVHGVNKLIDVLGPYPSEGMYVYCFAITDESGYPVYPGEKHLEECRRRLYEASRDTETLDMAVNRINKENKEKEKKEARLIADNIYQSMGISARRLHNAEISKPIIIKNENSNS